MTQYISDTIEVSNISPFELDVRKVLGGSAEVGWITSDDGSIYVQVNDRGAIKIPMQTDDTLLFEEEDDWVIKYLYITTGSVLPLTVRYFFKSLGIKIMEVKS